MKPARATAFTLFLVAAACGDDFGAGRPDAGRPDAGGDPGDEPDGGPTGATAFAVATDYFTAGVATTVSVPELSVTTGAVAEVASTDPVVRLHGDRLYIVNRFGHDNVTVLEASTLQLVDQISTGAGSNPQDVAVAGDLLYVAVLGGAGVAVIDLADPEAGVIDTIDLSELDPEDDLPDCHTLGVSGQHLLVACGILDDSFAPRGPGKVAIVSLGNRAITDEVELPHLRPFGFGLVVPASSELAADFLVPTVPNFAEPAAAGCVAAVKVDQGDGSGEVSCLVDNEDLGGFAGGLAYDGALDRIWMAVTSGFDDEDFGPLGHALAFDIGTGEVRDPVTSEEDRPMDVAVCPTGHVLLAESNRGLRVHEAGGATELTSEPLDLGLPPVAGGVVCY